MKLCNWWSPNILLVGSRTIHLEVEGPGRGRDLRFLVPAGQWDSHAAGSPLRPLGTTHSSLLTAALLSPSLEWCEWVVSGWSKPLRAPSSEIKCNVSGKRKRSGIKTKVDVERKGPLYRVCSTVRIHKCFKWVRLRGYYRNYVGSENVRT